MQTRDASQNFNILHDGAHSGDQLEYVGEKVSWNGDLGHLECEIAVMPTRGGPAAAGPKGEEADATYEHCVGSAHCLTLDFGCLDWARGCIMIDYSASLPPRLLTIHNTVIYVDPTSWQLKHGSRADSPPNVRLALDGVHGELVYEKEGSLCPVIYQEGHFTAIADDGKGPATRTVFELVSLDHGRVGLRANGLFLSAKLHTGNLTLSAKFCSGWENFVLWDPPPSRREMNAAGLRQTPSLSISCLFAYREPRDVSSTVRAIESTLQCIRADCLYWFSNVRYPNAIPGVDIVNISVPGLVDFQNDTCAVYL